MKVFDVNKWTEYQDTLGSKLPSMIAQYDFSDQHIDFGYSTQASAVYSSNIEGNTIDLNSYMNYQLSRDKLKHTKDVDEIDNLVMAYRFAQQHDLDKTNFLKCHELFPKTLVIKSKRGKYRIEKVGVYDAQGLVYLAIEPELIPEKMTELFDEISILLDKQLAETEVFYYASLIHLIFAHIHPFRDGNGRGARLLEKWFVASKLGERFWKIPSEKYYLDHRQAYYQNINLGVNYYELDYKLCLSFLLMLAGCLEK